MRELTFKGFLSWYVKQLSMQDSNSIFKLVAEAVGCNPRLQEPLLLYALYSDKQNILLQASKGCDLYDDYRYLLSQYDVDEMTELLKTSSPVLPDEYHKVWRSFLCLKNRREADNHTKELMRQKVKRLQEKSGITNYRIYTDLSLNPGNVNAWLKHGEADKVSLDTARRVLSYLENYS